jgi:hypothetical protein
LKETLDFKFQLFSHLKNLQISNQINLSSSQLDSLISFKKNKPFMVCECDKNIGSCLISNENYDRLCIENLSSTNNYTFLNYDPLNECIQYVKNILDELLISKNISKKLYNNLKTSKNKLGSFRILPKLHKKKFSVRPIINCKDHPTSKLSLLLSLILQPFVKDCESFIQDSQNLIQKTYRLKIPTGSRLFSGDFDSLYSNINLFKALTTITEFLSNKFFSKHITIFGIYKILETVLFNNCFKYKTKFLKQILGIAMGTICGPVIANIYVYILEKNWLSLYNPIIYYRYIDDIFAVVLLENLETLKEQFEELKLNVETGDTINFLDLLISIDKLRNLLFFSLFIKPTNTFCYLLYLSNHPKFIFKNIPKSLFIRLRRICSWITDYFFHSRELISNLVSRGYNFTFLKKICYTISSVDRETLIPYKDKKPKNDITDLFFKNFFDFNLLNLNLVFHSSFLKLKTLYPYLANQNINLINCLQLNISSLLVHNFKLDKKHYFKTKRCNKCHICKFINQDSFLNINNFLLPIQAYSRCYTNNVVYIIICKKCNLYYVGQTSRSFQVRIKEHIHSIKNFIPFQTMNSGVAIHFNIKGHNFQNDLSCLIFKSSFISDEERLDIELQLIHLIKNICNKIINIHIPKLYKNKAKLFSII